MFYIGQYGLKIKNIEASTLFEYNNGVRDHYEYKDAMFTNSLFMDFLLENGLKTWKNESTRDLICLEFNFGSRSFEEEINHLYKTAKSARTEYKIAKSHGNKVPIEKKRNKRKKIENLIAEAKANEKKYIKYSKEDIRTIFYNSGVDVEYISRRKNGEIYKRETIHYKMLYRSTGKAKKGSCMFIRDKLHKKAQDFLYMGIKLPKKNAPIVEISAYAPLVSSAIVGKIKINPKNILILKDIDRTFFTNVVSIETDKQRHCYAKHIDNYELKNTLFDGQALIDSSIFPSWGNGYILLRHHFCKMAAFSTNIQKFFKDYFGETYQTATVTDMFGNVHFVKDVELITTDNAMKWLKFDKSYDYWCDRVYDNGCMFGIVKTAHQSKLGDVQKMSYQMVNSLDESIMDNVVKESIEYVNRLKQDDDFFLEYLEKNKNFSNDYEVLIALVNQNREFLRSEYFRNRKKFIIQTYVINLKTGKIIQNAENLVIVGSPYAMLLYGATGIEKSVDNDDTFYFEKDTVQCYAERFIDGEYLAFFRSPFNAKNNLIYLHNVYNDKFRKYFNLGEQIIAINMNGSDIQDRGNGLDMDSDSGYTTNQVDIVTHAKNCYINYPTIVNNIPKEKNMYCSTMDDFAKIDNSLSNSQKDIGGSSNLAQIAQTYSCNFTDSKYNDYVCILSVIAQAAIDNAKRRFDIDITSEIRLLKSNMGIKENGYPAFWSLIQKDFNIKKVNYSLCCPMNCLYDLNLRKFRNSDITLPMSYFFIRHSIEKRDVFRKSMKVEELIQNYSLGIYNYNVNSVDGEYFLLRNDFEMLLRDIQMVNISYNYIGLFSWLLDRAFCISKRTVGQKDSLLSTLEKNKSILLNVLYNINNKCLLKCFKNV